MLVLAGVCCFPRSAPGQGNPPVIPVVPFSDGFEAYGNLSNLNGQGLWRVERGLVDILDDATLVRPGGAGTKIARLQPKADEPPATQAELRLSGTVLSGLDDAYLDFYILPVATLQSEREELMAIDGARIGFFRNSVIDTAAEFYVYQPPSGQSNADGEWVPTGASVPVNAAGAATQWVRMTIREDLDQSLLIANTNPDGLNHDFWDLWIDGDLVAASFSFDDTHQTFPGLYVLLGDVSWPVYLDDVVLTSDHPLGTDSDSDGFTDALESTVGSNPNLSDRTTFLDKFAASPPNGNGTADADQDGVTLAEETLYGSSDSQADTDNDGIGDRLEIDHGTDPVDATDKIFTATIDPILSLSIQLGCGYDSALWRVRVYELLRNGTYRKLRFTYEAPVGQIGSTVFKGRAAADYALVLERSGSGVALGGFPKFQFEVAPSVLMASGQPPVTVARIVIEDPFGLLHDSDVGSSLPPASILAQRTAIIRGLPAVEFSSVDFAGVPVVTNGGHSFKLTEHNHAFPLSLRFQRSDRIGRFAPGLDWFATDGGAPVSGTQIIPTPGGSSFVSLPGPGKSTGNSGGGGGGGGGGSNVVPLPGPSGAPPGGNAGATFTTTDADGQQGGGAGEATTEVEEAEETEEQVPAYLDVSGAPGEQTCGCEGADGGNNEPSSGGSGPEGASIGGGGARIGLPSAGSAGVSSHPGNVTGNSALKNTFLSIAGSPSGSVTDSGVNGWPALIMGSDGTFFEFSYPTNAPRFEIIQRKGGSQNNANNPAIRKITVENPGGDLNRMTVTEENVVSNLVLVRHEYVNQPLRTVLVNGSWWHLRTTDYTRTNALGLPLERATRITSELASSPYDLTSEQTILRNPITGAVHRTETTVTRRYPWGNKLVSSTRTSGTESRTSTYDYWTATGESMNDGQLKSMVSEDGSWAAYEYDSQGRHTKTVSSRLDNPFDPQDAANSNYVTAITYHDGADRDVVTTVGGIETDRRYLRHFDEQNHRRVEESVALVPGASLAACANNVTTWWFAKQGIGAGSSPSKVRYPDGTFSVTEISLNATNTIAGRLDNAGGLLEGTQTIRARLSDDAAAPWSVAEMIVHPSLGANALPWASETVTLSGGGVSSGNYTATTTASDGSSSREIYSGGRRVDSRRRDGSGETDLVYDSEGRMLERRVFTPPGASGVPGSYLETHTPDPFGRVIASYRDGQLVEKINYNGFDEIESRETPYGSGATQRIVATTVSIGGGTVVTTTETDLATSEVLSESSFARYADGRSKSESRLLLDGQGLLPIQRTSFGLWAEGETELIEYPRDGEGAGPAVEWTRRYYRMGRLVKVETPVGTTQYEHDILGRVERVIDPDGVATMTYYNIMGRIEYEGIDTDRNGFLDYYGGLDRFTAYGTSYRVEAGRTIRVSLAATWLGQGSMGNNHLLTTTHEWGDGLRSEVRKQASTGPVTVQVVERVPMTDGGMTLGWTTCETRADGVKALTVSRYGGTTFSAEYPAGASFTLTPNPPFSVPLHSTTYTYDDLGRLFTETDSRTGTSTHTYSATGHLHTITAPHPQGAASGASVTVIEDKPEVRSRLVTLPDNTQRLTWYRPDGNVLVEYGDQIVNIYGYDRQGRVRSLAHQLFFGPLTEWIYDAAGRLASKKYPSLDENGDGTLEPRRSVSYTYTAAGRTKTRTWARGRLTTYHYHSGTGDLVYVDHDGTDTPDLAIYRDTAGRVIRVEEGVMDSNAVPMFSSAYFNNYWGGPVQVFPGDLSLFNGGPVLLLNSGNPEFDSASVNYGEITLDYYGTPEEYTGYYFETPSGGNVYGTAEIWSDVFTATGLVHHYAYNSILPNPGRVTEERIENLLPFDESVTLNRQYQDASGRISDLSVKRGATQKLDIDYTWAPNGQLDAVAATYPSAAHATNATTGRREELFQYAYAHPGNGFLPTSLRSRHVPAPGKPLTETVWAYHSASNSVSSMTHSVSPTLAGAATFTASQHGYALDALGRRTRHDFTATQAPWANLRQDYLYNNRSEIAASNATLLQANGTPGAASKPANRQYSFDGRGNRLWAAGGLNAVGTVPGTALPADAFTAGSPKALDQFATAPANTYHSRARTLTGAQGATIARRYDADGNLIYDGYFSYVWDAENRLLEVFPGLTKTASGNPTGGVDFDSHLKFAYDYRGRRVSRERAFGYSDGPLAWWPVDTQRFVYDGWNLVYSRRNVTYSESPASPAAWSDNVWVWGQDLGGAASLQGAGGVGGLLVATLTTGGDGAMAWADTAPAYYLYDANGNVANVVGPTGTVDLTYRYDPFGNAEAFRPANGGSRFDDLPWNDQPITFSTKWRESTNIYAREIPYAPGTQNDHTNTGDIRPSALHYYGYRYYAPKDGRWLGRDPIGERGGVNLFGFVGNGPVSEIDCLGNLTAVKRSFRDKTYETNGGYSLEYTLVGNASENVFQDVDAYVTFTWCSGKYRSLFRFSYSEAWELDGNGSAFDFHQINTNTMYIQGKVYPEVLRTAKLKGIPVDKIDLNYNIFQRFKMRTGTFGFTGRLGPSLYNYRFGHIQSRKPHKRIIIGRFVVPGVESLDPVSSDIDIDSGLHNIPPDPSKLVQVAPSPFIGALRFEVEHQVSGAADPNTGKLKPGTPQTNSGLDADYTRTEK